MSNRASYVQTTKEYRNLERQMVKPGVFRRLAQNLANKMYARKKLAPINYKLSIGWKQHVMGLLRKQQEAQQKLNNLKKSWKRGMPPVNFKTKLNNAQRNLEEAKRHVKNARKQKVLTIGSTEYTKKGVTPVVSAVPVVKRSNLNNNIQHLVNIARKNPPKLHEVLNDEFNRLFPFRPENNRVKMRKKLASMKGVPWSVQRAATRRAIKLGRAAIYHNQQQAFKNAEAKRKKVEVIGRMKEKLNNNKARENAAKRVKKNYTPLLSTIRENNNNGPKSHALVNNPLYNSNNGAYPLPKPNNSNSNNNNFHNTLEEFPENVYARGTSRAANLLFNQARKKKAEANAKFSNANAARAVLERKLANKAAANALAANKAAAAVEAANKAAAAAAKAENLKQQRASVKNLVSGAIGKVLSRRHIQLRGEAEATRRRGVLNIARSVNAMGAVPRVKTNLSARFPVGPTRKEAKRLEAEVRKLPTWQRVFGRR